MRTVSMEDCLNETYRQDNLESFFIFYTIPNDFLDLHKHVPEKQNKIK